MLVCYVSGSAHLVYVVLPWYLWRTLWPAPARPRGRGRGARPAPGASLPEGSILGFSAAFGGILCLLAIGLWAAQNDLPGAIFASVGLGDLAAVSGPADRAFAGGDVV
jgi:hypothetical protein